MSHSIEPATSGRAKCRGCGRPIDKGELRLGEQLPNPYAEGEMTLWFHPTCAAYKRPEALIEALAVTGVAVDAQDALLAYPDPQALADPQRRLLAHRTRDIYLVPSKRSW
jgi:poly(ADP-ribose) polymerase-like protein